MSKVRLDAIDCSEPPCIAIYDIGDTALIDAQQEMHDAWVAEEIATEDCYFAPPTAICSHAPPDHPRLVSDQRSIARMNRWLWDAGQQPYLFHEAFQ